MVWCPVPRVRQAKNKQIFYTIFCSLDLGHQPNIIKFANIYMYFMGIFNKKSPKKMAQKVAEGAVLEKAKAFAKSIHEHLEKARPLVTVDEEVTVINGEKKETTMRISIGERDNILLSEREYKELLGVMVSKLDNDALVHLIWAQHEAKHTHGVDAVMSGIEDMLKGRGFDIEEVEIGKRSQ